MTPAVTPAVTPVVGLDPSLTGTGISCAEHTDVLETPKGCDGTARLDWIRAEILKHVAARPLVVIEGYSFNSHFGGERLGELGGVIRWTLWKRAISYVEISPATLKLFATGNGRAKKDEVLSAAVRAGYEGSNNNGADAHWLRQIGLYGQVRGDVARTAYRDRAMGKIVWPETVAA